MQPNNYTEFLRRSEEVHGISPGEWARHDAPRDDEDALESSLHRRAGVDTSPTASGTAVGEDHHRQEDTGVEKPVRAQMSQTPVQEAGDSNAGRLSIVRTRPVDVQSVTMSKHENALEDFEDNLEVSPVQAGM